jgi:chromosome segregation ATPase
MEVSKKSYNALLAHYRELETTLATLSGRKEEATKRLNTLEGQLEKLTKGMDVDEVLARLEKEAEVRIDTLRAKVVELERLVADFKVSKINNDFDVEV